MNTNSFLKGILALSIGIMPLASCNEANPEMPLYEEDIRILTDVMLLEGVLQDFSGDEKDSLSVLNYNVLYDRYGITEQGLQELRQRYSEDPTLWTRSSDSVVARPKGARTDFETLLNLGLN